LSATFDIASVQPAPKITPLLQRVFDYWDAKRGERAMPTRQDIDPSEIKSLLPHIMLGDVLRGPNDRQPYDFRIRLVGTAVEPRFSGRRTGVLMSDLIPWTAESKAWGKLETVVRTAKPSFEPVPYVGQHSDYMTMVDVALPLSEDGVSVSMLLVAMDFIPRNSA
jgi:hypothetical protein